MGITMVLLFVKTSPSAFGVVYYGSLTILFWLLFVCFFVPFLSWGAEITRDYHQRTTLRSFTYIFILIGSTIGTALPPAIVMLFESFHLETRNAWTGTAIVLSLVTSATIFISALLIKTDTFIKKEERRPFSLKLLAISYAKALKLKPLIYLLLGAGFYLIMNTLAGASRIYFFTINLGFSMDKTSLVLVIVMLCGGLLTLPVALISKRTDKRTAVIICLAFDGACLFAARAINEPNAVSVVIMMAGFLVGSAAYWQLAPAMIYDVCDYDELVNFKRREGVVTSLLSIVEAIAGAASMQFFGILLESSGYISGADAQAPSAVQAIYDCQTLLPAIFLTISCVFFILFPITKKRFFEIENELKKRGA
jgi:GPH family glycoside/pentoside/hexuronide:cation symporter